MIRFITITSKILLMKSYGNNHTGSSKGHRSQRRMRTKGLKSRQQQKTQKKTAKQTMVVKENSTKHEVTPEQVYWKKRHAIDIYRERTHKQSLGIPQNDGQPETDTNHDAAKAYVAWENHIKNIEYKNTSRAWNNHIEFLERENNLRSTASQTNRGTKRKFSELF